VDKSVKPSDSIDSAAGLQPFLHDACLTLYAPSFAVSRADGQLLGGVDGFYHGDRRALCRLEVAGEGMPTSPNGRNLKGADRAAFRYVLRGVGEHSPDPAVTLDRRRDTTPGCLEETLELSNAGIHPVHVRLTVTAGTDLATMEAVKTGIVPPLLPAAGTGQELTWSDASLTVSLTSTPPCTVADPSTGRLYYDIDLEPGARWQTRLTVTARDAEGDQFPAPPPGSVPWATPRLRSADRNLDRWLYQSIADLERLLLTDGLDTRDMFLAAGAPWFLTLFGRDSLWAARMLLPLGTELAAGTLD
jgi:hypothetical protein